LLPVAVAVIAIAAPGLALATEWPDFKPGSWQFDRTIEGTGPSARTIARTECVDPTAEENRQQAQLAQAGCLFTPLARKGSTYQYSATCKIGSMTATSNTTLAVRSREAYTITVDSVAGSVRTREVLTATRLGDCPK
jgi:hypothetical protein